MKNYDIAVFIGRFQPVHNAHVEIIRRASEIADKVIVIIGSAYQPRTYKNPWTERERLRMVDQSIPNDIAQQIRIKFNYDTIYNEDSWVARTQRIVSDCWDDFADLDTESEPRVCIIGHSKDESSYYLKKFPQWKQIEVESLEPLDAQQIRDLYFRARMNFNFLKEVVPPSTMEYLYEFAEGEEYLQVIRERKFIENYKRQYEHLPYAPIFVTADAVVIQSGHVLMVKRRAEPGKGLWAFPGGFVNATTDKSVLDAAIRELKEETGIKVPVPVLYGSIQDDHVFDAINRSARGRTITHAFKIVLSDGELPKVKGQDDAEKAVWIPLSEVKSTECFEDHYEILQYFTGVGYGAY